MFCKNCGEQIPEGARFCPACGTESRSESLAREKPKRVFKEKIDIRISGLVLCMIVALIVVLLVGVQIGRMGGKAEKKGPAASLDQPMEATEAYLETTEEETEETIIGVWKCERGEVTFTDKGNMMLGQNGIVLGDGWVQYEVVDQSTIYISGGDLPIGMNIAYELDGDALKLEIQGMTMVFLRER